MAANVVLRINFCSTYFIGIAFTVCVIIIIILCTYSINTYIVQALYSILLYTMIDTYKVDPVCICVIKHASRYMFIYVSTIHHEDRGHR